MGSHFFPGADVFKINLFGGGFFWGGFPVEF